MSTKGARTTAVFWLLLLLAWTGVQAQERIPSPLAAATAGAPPVPAIWSVPAAGLPAFDVVPATVADDRVGGLIPPGALRYRVPDAARPFALPYAVVGAGLLIADEPVLRALKLDSLFLREDGTAASQAHLVFRTFSRLGDPPLVAAALAGLFVFGGDRERDAAKVGAVAYGNTLALTFTLKTLTGKERPYVSGGRLRYHGPNLRYHSWPSGHSSGSSSVAHVLAHYYPDARLLWYGLSGMTGASRIALARHWPSDVWWGWGLGVVAAEGALGERERIELWWPW